MAKAYDRDLATTETAVRHDPRVFLIGEDVAEAGQPAVQPTLVLTLSCDHRALDGARGARFLGALAYLIEEPLALPV